MTTVGERVRVISLGAGVQSSAMLLLGVEGAFGDLPDCAIFADTKGEPDNVYKWLDALEAFVAPFPIYRVSAGDLGAEYLAGKRRASIPAYSTTQHGKKTLLSQHCTFSFKKTPIRRKLRELVGPRGTAESWIGISMDECHRMKTSDRKWNPNRYPLIDLRLKRMDCAAVVLDRIGVEAPKSACYFCPYHGEDYWLNLKRSNPKDFARAVEFDKQLRQIDGDKWERDIFLHRSLKPLDQVKFRHEDQLAFDESGFGNECQGLCGV